MLKKCIYKNNEIIGSFILDYVSRYLKYRKKYIFLEDFFKNSKVMKYSTILVISEGKLFNFETLRLTEF